MVIIKTAKNQLNTKLEPISIVFCYPLNVIKSFKF